MRVWLFCVLLFVGFVMCLFLLVCVLLLFCLLACRVAVFCVFVCVCVLFVVFVCSFTVVRSGLMFVSRCVLYLCLCVCVCVFVRVCKVYSPFPTRFTPKITTLKSTGRPRPLKAMANGFMYNRHGHACD